MLNDGGAQHLFVPPGSLTQPSGASGGRAPTAGPMKQQPRRIPVLSRRPRPVPVPTLCIIEVKALTLQLS